MKALDNIVEVLAPLKNSVLIDELATKVAYRLPGIEVDTVKNAIRNKPLPKQAEASRTPAPEAPAQQQAPLSYEQISMTERRQLKMERELLSLVALYPDELRGFAQRMTSFAWADSRHEAVLWAMLSTPDHTSPKDVVAAALSVEPASAQLLSEGEAVESVEAAVQKASAYLDALELASAKRRLKQVKAALHGQGGMDGQALRGLFEEATLLQKRINELTGLMSRATNQ